MFHHMENMSEAEKQKKKEDTLIAKAIVEENYQQVKIHKARKQQDKADDVARRDRNTIMQDLNTENEDLQDEENSRYAKDVCEENYQQVKEHRALEQQNKEDAVARRDYSRMVQDLSIANENRRDEENTRYAKEVCADNYQRVKEHRALEKQNKADDVARRDCSTVIRDCNTANEKLHNEENTRYAKEVCEENYQQVKAHRAVRQQNKANDMARYDFDTKMQDVHSKNDNIREEDGMVVTYAFSEELIDPVA